MVLGKIAIVIGSGIVGTLVTGGDAGKLPDLRDVLSVSFKFMTKQDKKEGSSAASPHTDQLLSQVNYLREQLRVLSDQKEMPHIIINGRPGAGAYGLTAIALGAIGYLYIRWKGWKIADLMFVTKRGLSDACNVVGKQLDQVSESVHASKKHLSGRIDRVNCNLDECHEILVLLARYTDNYSTCSTTSNILINLIIFLIYLLTTSNILIHLVIFWKEAERKFICSWFETLHKDLDLFHSGNWMIMN